MSFDLSKCPKNEQGHLLARTKDGRAVRIVCTDAKTDQSIVALVTYEDGDELARHYNRDGKFLINRTSEADLENIPQRVKRWLNFTNNGSAYSHNSAEAAMESANSGNFSAHYLAIAVPVEFEVRG